MIKKQQYKIFISATILSTLKKEQIERQLVASLFDVENEIKTSDGDNQEFEILDYEFTQVIKN
ncbi:MAG: hypothetical protein H0A76_07020 [Candidatus Thiodubiliella endoseptemdiera]|uniref:Uncharacterized protein n=1 Tax=Candidatus Thiodubiliella endoseptemdiera TaxID=2738886 RepID=A0A853F2B1_9GAMM|nr:hypothetical protein [Candidatus Thiodubiliella endoseptemdiera]